MKIKPFNPLKDYQRWSSDDRGEASKFPKEIQYEQVKRKKVSEIAMRNLPLDKQLPRDKI